jgi:LuxR family transcriptional regulator of csgAB operon
LFDGECWLPRQVVADYLYRTRQKPKKVLVSETFLTKRERQILDLTATGASNVDIAEKLNLSMHTVKTHIYNLFKKLGVSNRMQAVNWAKEHLEEFNNEQA